MVIKRDLKYMTMKRFLFLIIAAILMSQSVYAQNEIIYTDFEPNLCLEITSYNNYSTDTLKVDVNHDNVTDFFIKMTVESGGVWFDYWTTDLESRVIDWDDNNNDSIVASDEAVWWALPNSIGAPYGIHDISFMFGFREIVNDNYCYAWLLLHINDVSYDNKHLCIDQYAYCTIPNYPLRWGQTTLNESVEENTYMPVAIYPNPTDGVLNISFSENTECQSVEIYAIDGRLLKSQISNLEIVDVSKLNAGVYILKVNMADGKEFTERIVKE